jgi:CRISPR-associated protein Cas1
MEEFRPLVADRLALNLVNLDAIKAGDFHKEDGKGFYLNDEARKRFLREYERVMTAEFAHKLSGERTGLRRALYGQAIALQKVILEGGDYQPFNGWR